MNTQTPCTPTLQLFTAALAGSIDGTNAALQAGADCSAPFPHASTLQVFAAMLAPAAMARLRQGVPTSTDPTLGFSPLHAACLANQPQLVGRLLLEGANPEVCDSAGNTPLHIAVAVRAEAACGAMLTRGASLKATNQQGQSASSLAMEGQFMEDVFRAARSRDAALDVLAELGL